MSRSAAFGLAAVVALCIATLGLFHGDLRFVTAREVPVADFAPGLNGWQITVKGVEIIGGDAPVAHLTADDTAPAAMLAYMLPGPGELAYVRVTAEIRANGIRSGPVPWHSGGVMLQSLGRDGHAIPYWPYTVARVSGASDWRAYRTVIPMNAGTVQMRLLVYLAGGSGAIWVRNLTVEAVTESATGRVMRMGLGVLWFIFGVWIVVSLVARRRLPATGYLALAVGAAILVLVLAPQPELTNDVKAVAAKIDSVLMAAVERPQGPAAPAGQPVPAPTGATAQAPDGKPGPVTLQIAKFSRRSFAGFGVQDLGHFAAYAALAFLAVLGFADIPRRRLIVYLLAVAVATEVLQSFTVTRTPQLVDGILNIAGIMSGSLGAFAWRRFAAPWPGKVRRG